jgi:hypothetical protein
MLYLKKYMLDSSSQPKIPETKKIGSFVERLRSFESDVARLKGVHLEPVVPEQKIEIQKPKPVQPIIAGKPEPHLEANGNSLNSLRATNTIVSDVKKEDHAKVVAALHKEPPVQTFHTIQTDITDNAKGDATTVKKIMAEQAVKQTRHIVIEDPKRSAYLLAISGLLVIGGLIALGGFYLINHQPKAPAPVAANAATIIAVQSNRDIMLDDTQSIISQIANAQTQAPGVANEIVKLTFKDNVTGKPINSQRFASLLSNTIPTWLVRSFEPAPYLVGLYNNAGWQPLILFKVTSYDSGYAGMLKWEETIAGEWAPLLSNQSTSTLKFKDDVIQNKDVRVLTDASGHKLLFYSFTDPTTLVITPSEQALREVFARLTTSQFLR